MYRSSPSTVYYESPPVVDVGAPVVNVVSPLSATDQAFHNGLWAARAEGVAIAAGAYYLYDSFAHSSDEDDERDDGLGAYVDELSETRALMRELATEHEAADPLVAAIQMPVSGTYKGSSAEDDDGDQEVATNLRFSKDGTVSGSGVDGVDGRYTIKEGRWSTQSTKLSGGRVAWIEVYDEGFEVALRGQIRDDGVIRALWASDRGVSGSVELVHDCKR